jgi:hypothetical protein
MHKWYVKARDQEDHDERAETLGVPIVLEDDSPDSLPYVILQVGRVGEDDEYRWDNLIFSEPVEKSTLDAVPNDDPFPFWHIAFPNLHPQHTEHQHDHT